MVPGLMGSSPGTWAVALPCWPRCGASARVCRATVCCVCQRIGSQLLESHLLLLGNIGWIGQPIILRPLKVLRCAFHQDSVCLPSNLLHANPHLIGCCRHAYLLQQADHMRLKWCREADSWSAHRICIIQIPCTGRSTWGRFATAVAR